MTGNITILVKIAIGSKVKRNKMIDNIKKLVVVILMILK